jgi:transcriptional regulator with XRE-family HTH domain
MRQDSDSATARSLGDKIRQYRLRRRQIHSNARWAQEDLAVAIGSDKSHINRIERGHGVPRKDTLERICEALALSWPERIQIFGLAGYLIDRPVPTPEEVEHVTRHSESLLQSSSYPVCLMDREYRIWDLNELHAQCWLGFRSRADALDHVRGLRTIDKLLDPKISEWWEQIIVDFGAYARRALTRFEHTASLLPSDPGTEATVRQLRDDPRYAQLWAEITSAGSDDMAPAFLDHQMVDVVHPQLGPYRIWIWHSSLTIDERFFLSHHVPADGDSQALFEHLAVRGAGARSSIPTTQGAASGRRWRTPNSRLAARDD